MSSSSHKRRKRLAEETEASGLEMAPCSNCRKSKGPGQRKCIVGPRSGKCSECIRKGCKDCDVKVSRPEWEKLRDVRDQLRLDIEKIEEEEIKLKMRKVRLRKQLRLAERRTDDAVAEELDDLEEAEAAETQFLSLETESGVEASESVFPFSDVLEMPPVDWALISGVSDPFWEMSGLSGGISSEANGSS